MVLICVVVGFIGNIGDDRPEDNLETESAEGDTHEQWYKDSEDFVRIEEVEVQSGYLSIRVQRWSASKYEHPPYNQRQRAEVEWKVIRLEGIRSASDQSISPFTLTFKSTAYDKNENQVLKSALIMGELKEICRWQMVGRQELLKEGVRQVFKKPGKKKKASRKLRNSLQIS